MASSTEDSGTPPSSPPLTAADLEMAPLAGEPHPSTAPGPSSPKPTPREDALNNRDVLTLIFMTFLPSTPNPLDVPHRRFLLNLALQCRSFSEPALDCLWKHLGSLVPLIRLLPTATLVGDVYSLSGSATGVSVSFNKYAKRVRSLHIGTLVDRQDRVDPSVYVLLNKFLNGEPLLPGLVTLQFEAVTGAFSWHTLPILFPCASLSDIVLGSGVCAHALAHHIALPLLVCHAPSLRALTVISQTYYDGGQRKSVVEDGVFRFQHLRSFSYATARNNGYGPWVPIKTPHSFLFNLGSRLRHLERLTLDVELHTIHEVDSREPVGRKKKKGRLSQPPPLASAEATTEQQGDQQQLQGNPDLFPDLRTLTITHRSNTDILQCPGFRSLIHNLVHLTIAMRPSWMVSFTSIIDALAGCPLLRLLSLNDTEQDVRIDAGDVLYILAHLNLDELRLDVHQLHRHTNQECLGNILTAATGLQEDPEPLRSLTLPRTWGSDDPSLESLVDVARKAPKLEYFGITLNSFTPNLSSLISLTSSPDIPRSSALKYLHLRDLRGMNQPFTPAEYKVIAQYLDTCFPNLISIAIHAPPGALTVGHWAHIEHLLVLYQETRRFHQSRR